MLKPVDKLVRKVGLALALKLGIAQVRAAATGQLGPVWKHRYDALQGKKTLVGLGLALAAAVLASLGHQADAALVGAVAGFMLQVGLLDKAWRSYIPEALAESRAYRWLAAHSAGLATALTTALAVLEVPGLQAWHYHHAAQLTVVGLGAACAQLGLVDAAWRAQPPWLTPNELTDAMKESA